MKYKRGENPNSRNGFKKGHKGFKGNLGRNFTKEHVDKLRLLKLNKPWAEARRKAQENMK